MNMNQQGNTNMFQNNTSASGEEGSSANDNMLTIGDHVNENDGFRAPDGADPLLISLRVGKEKKFMMAEKWRLIKVSGYFNTCLSGAYREKGMIEFPKDHPLVFESFIGWMYTGELPRVEFVHPLSDTKNTLWINMHLFAERYQCRKFAYALLKALHKQMSEFLNKRRGSGNLTELIPYIDPTILNTAISRLQDEYGLKKMITVFLILIMPHYKDSIDTTKYDEDLFKEVGKTFMTMHLRVSKLQPFPELDVFMLEPSD